MHIIRTTFLTGRYRAVVRVGGSKDRGWSVFRMAPTPHGHRFDRVLKEGFVSRKEAEAWAKKFRAGEVKAELERDGGAR